MEKGSFKQDISEWGNMGYDDCTSCLYKEKCTRAKRNKRLYISKSFLEKCQESYENILSETGILYRMNRSIQVKGASEILLLCMGDNLHKLHTKKSGRNS